MKTLFERFLTCLFGLIATFVRKVGVETVDELLDQVNYRFFFIRLCDDVSWSRLNIELPRYYHLKWIYTSWWALTKYWPNVHEFLFFKENFWESQHRAAYNPLASWNNLRTWWSEWYYYTIRRPIYRVQANIGHWWWVHIKRPILLQKGNVYTAIFYKVIVPVMRKHGAKRIAVDYKIGPFLLVESSYKDCLDTLIIKLPFGRFWTWNAEEFSNYHTTCFGKYGAWRKQYTFGTLLFKHTIKLRKHIANFIVDHGKYIHDDGSYYHIRLGPLYYACDMPHGERVMGLYITPRIQVFGKVIVPRIIVKSLDSWVQSVQRIYIAHYP